MGLLFIIGPQRSGTTLLWLLLNAHSQVAIPEEGTFWLPLICALRHDLKKPITGKTLSSYIKYLKKNDQMTKWNIDTDAVLDRFLSAGSASLSELMTALYSEFAISNNKLYWGDKTPGFFRNIRELAEIFPAVKFIHIARDGRDVFLSRRNFRNKYKIKHGENVAVAAMEWKYKIKKIRASLSQLGAERSIEVRYEDILNKPEEKLQKICFFLGIRYEDSILDFWKTSHKYVGSHHSDLIFQPINPCSCAKWKKKMTNEENAIFEYIAGNLLSHLSYEIKSTSPDKSLRIQIYWKLFSGLPARALQVITTALVLRFSSFFGLRTRASGGLFSEQQP